MGVISETVPCKTWFGEGVDPDLSLLAGPDEGHLRLVDLGANPHMLRVGKIKERLALADRDALLDRDLGLPDHWFDWFA